VFIWRTVTVDQTKLALNRDEVVTKERAHCSLSTAYLQTLSSGLWKGLGLNGLTGCFMSMSDVV
jgi:hypothetical protein